MTVGSEQLWETFNAPLRQFIRQKGNAFSKTEDVMRLTLRQRDASMFRTYVQDVVSLQPLLDADSAQFDNDAQRNVQANAAVFVSRLAVTSSWV